MKRLVSACAVAFLLLSPAGALAKKTGGPGGPIYVPPSQSAASEYTEDVPTAGGNTPSGDIHHASAPLGGSGGGSGGTGAGGSASGSGRSGASSISGSTLSAMSHSGTTGAAAASVAEALAPTVVTKSTPKPKRHGATQANHAPTAGVTTSSVTKVTSGSAAGQVARTLIGSDAGSGIGVLLPIILIVSLVAATVLGLTRLRRPGAA